MKHRILSLLTWLALAGAAAAQTSTLTINTSTGLVNIPAGSATPNFAALKLGGTVLGSLYQPLDSDLTLFAAITPSANVQTLLSSADYAAFRNSLTLGTASAATHGSLVLGDAIDYTAPAGPTKALSRNLLDQIWTSELDYEWLPNLTYAATSVAGSGDNLLTGIGGQVWLRSGATANSRSSWAYQVMQQLVVPPGPSKQISFDHPVWVTFRFAFITELSAEGVFRGSLGKVTTNGALEAAGIGFTVTYNAAGVGNLNLVAHNGSAPTTNSGVATLDTTNGQVVNEVTLVSDATGNVYGFLNGTYAGVVTGGPTTETGSDRQLVMEIINGTEAVANGVIFTSIRTRVKKN